MSTWVLEMSFGFWLLGTEILEVITVAIKYFFMIQKKRSTLLSKCVTGEAIQKTDAVSNWEFWCISHVNNLPRYYYYHESVNHKLLKLDSV